MRTRGVGPLMAAAAFARLPIGMLILALILLLRAEGLDYAALRAVSGCSALGLALGAPLLGRVADRLGQTTVLATTASLSLAARARLAIAALGGAGVGGLVVLALVAGARTPPVSRSASR